MMSLLKLLVVGVHAALATAGDVGILYEVWHTKAALAMAAVAAKGFPQLNVELVIQSKGASTLNDVYGPAKLDSDIFNVQPQLGYYCLYRARPGDPHPPLPDCANISQTALAHATQLSGAGIDYVAIDVTNWPQNDTDGSTDIAVLRPTEVLFEEWAALRARGINTPAISIWPCSPVGGTTWRYLLDRLYNNASYSDLIYKQGGAKVVFLPYAGANCYDAGEAALIRANGGRNDVSTVPMWALFGRQAQNEGAWGFFAPCTDPSGAYTTSMVGENIGPCNQFPTMVNGTQQILEVSASGGYMVSQCALPFAAPGHFRGLTLARLFEQVLALQPPHVFISSFNEMIGGRQAPAYGAKTAFNMGLPADPQRMSVWVDTYASEFSRDLEPTVEGGNATWVTAVSCIHMYKAGRNCSAGGGSEDEPCCTRHDKEVFGNVWSLALKDGTDHLLTQLAGERQALLAGGSWRELCHPVPNPTAFCVDPSEPDGRSGPFMLYNTSAVPDTVAGGMMAVAPLYRCITSAGTPPQAHFFSNDVTGACEGLGTAESVLGYMATAPGREMLRALHRCVAPSNSSAVDAVAGAPVVRFHALDLPCDNPDPEFSGALGYVR